MKAKLLGAVALGLMVAACGTNPTDRTTGGAAAGAATGAAVGALGGPVGALGGAAIGGGVGAVAGATTTPDQVNLGRPVWNDPEVRVPGVTNNASGASSRGSGYAQNRNSTRQIQQALAQRGYNPGPTDGVMGPQTRSAITQFQRDNNMQATGRADAQLANALNVSDTATGSTSANDRNRAYMGGGMVVDQNQNQTRGTTGTGSGSTMGSMNERRGTATDADPGTGGTGGSGGGVPRAQGGGSGAFNSPSTGTRPDNTAGGRLERSGTATDADPGAGGTGGSGGGATGLPRR